MFENAPRYCSRGIFRSKDIKQIAQVIYLIQNNLIQNDLN